MLAMKEVGLTQRTKSSTYTTTVGKPLAWGRGGRGASRREGEAYQALRDDGTRS